MSTIEGNLLEVTRGILVHGCNCRGVMGGGIALSVKNKWPYVYEVYERTHASMGLKLGSVLPVKVGEELYVVNAMTQDNLGTSSIQVDYPAVRKCFAQVRILANATGLPVMYPLIGCGLAGGDWKVVSKIIMEELHGTEHHLYIFPPPAKSTSDESNNSNN